MSKSGIIKLRDKQGLDTICSDSNVQVFAPKWVKGALQKLAPSFQNATFSIQDTQGTAKNQKLIIEENISLTQLIAIARSERANVSGVINFSQYSGISEEAIIALRDIVKHCVIIGKDRATHYGGYPSGSPIILDRDVYICDLAALQFQQLNNTGRHVLISQDDSLPKGLLDQEIFKNTVGQNKLSFKQAKENNSNRFLDCSFRGNNMLFDSVAFQAFVAQDFLLSAESLNIMAQKSKNNDLLNFKFLKYGTGFFADQLDGCAKNSLDLHLALGVLKGIESLFSQEPSTYSQIKSIELPFFTTSKRADIMRVLRDINVLCRKNNVQFASNNQDCLEQTSEYMTATTNCADPHAPTGNEMNYGSVDAAIAENLKRKGNNFSPICNPEMKEAFINVDHLRNSNFLQRNQTNNVAHLKSNIFLQRNTTSIKKYNLIFAGTLSGLLRFGLHVSLVTSSLVGLLAFTLIETGNFLRNAFKSKQYESYKSKTNTDLDDLSPQQIRSFHIGVEASTGFLPYAKSFLNKDAIMSPKDYYAGLEASMSQDEALVSKVKTKLS